MGKDLVRTKHVRYGNPDEGKSIKLRGHKPIIPSRSFYRAKLGGSRVGTREKRPAAYSLIHS
ncbi:hypothetical protein BDDG_11589 [Blastomyces dermatitidis ATCC 18188]|uniref:Uncharacterized protein n=1 Tax=Ajellomyces dermatitidis (strain ATCC 18188 / CBS 674.68) TaxID=653446 RepID=A0A0J9EJP0_AJEDA|nr:hypothetical protein BDDG_11589 [Blastomyces dermatitidis ATCC 18188]